MIEFLKNGTVTLENIKSGAVGLQRSCRKRGNFLTIDDIAIRGINNSTLFHQDDSSQYSDMTLSHIFDFRSVYPLERNDPDDEYFSFGIEAELGQPDHIFYTSGNDNKMKLVAFQKLLQRSALEVIGPIPNAVLPSDHLSLTAKFCLR